MKNFWKMVLAVICGILLLNALIIAVISGLATPKTPAVPAEGVLKIDMSKVIIDEQSKETDPMTMIQSRGQSPATIGIWEAARALDAAANDPGIKYIYLKTDGSSTSLAKLYEFRKALTTFRQSSGKAVVAYMEAPSTGSYYLASVADKIYMTPHPGATVTMNGLSSQMFFLGDLLKKFGVNVQLIRHGKYKSAAEMYTRGNSSPENREQYQVMINSMWKSVSTDIAMSRGIDINKFNDLIDNLSLCLPQDFIDNSLVDELLDRKGLEDQLAVLAVADKFKDVTMIPFADYATAKVLPGKGSKKIAVIYADGEIVDGSAQEQVA